jgi:hypothetical protein
VTGRAVAVIARAEMAPGTYAVPWNGLDARGRAVASGMYFAKLRIGETSFVRKMVLVR